MNKEQLQTRTKFFAVDLIQISNQLPNEQIGWTIKNHFIRSSTSVASIYRSACKSANQLIYNQKIELVLEELDECLFWLEMTAELELVSKLNELTLVINEARQLLGLMEGEKVEVG